MIARQYPFECGLQETLCGEALRFKVCNQPFVQILHNGLRHWVCVSTYGCAPGEIKVIDTLFKDRLSISLKKQICCLLKHSDSTIKVTVVPVQQQSSGSVDCGGFAVAWARKIAEEKDVLTNHAFDESQLRPHLLRSLENQQLGRFPDVAWETFSGKVCRRKNFKLRLHCSCRMIWLEEEELLPNKCVIYF